MSTHRDKQLIKGLVELVKGAALCRSLLPCLDWLQTYWSACRRIFRNPWRTGKPSRLWLAPRSDIHLVQVVKRYARWRVTGVTRRLVQGVVERLLRASQNGGVLNTAFIEQISGTFRSRLSLLTH